VEVVGFDGGGEGVAEFDRFGGGIDFDFVFRLAVFLDLEGDVWRKCGWGFETSRFHAPSGASLGMMNSVVTEPNSSVLRFSIFSASSPRPLWTVRRPVGWPSGIRRVRSSRRCGGELQVDGVAGFVERAVGDAVGEVAVAVVP
jgi:hypothetical protein